MGGLRLAVGGAAVGAVCALLAAVALPALGAPSGGLIAFDQTLYRDTLGNYYSAIYVARSDGTGVRRVTPIDDLIEDPAWSPDGSRIAYPRFPHGIWVVNADGRGNRKLCELTGLPVPYACSGNPTWSPDGRRIAYTDGEAIGVMRSDGSGHRLLLRFKGGEPKELDWSPDGTRFAFTGVPEDLQAWNGVWLVNADGSGLRRFARDVHHPRWSPDGKRLLVIGGNPGGYMRNIYVVDRRGGRPTLVVRKAPVYSASWSPDGRRIAYTSGDRIHIFDLKTRRDAPLTLRPSPCVGHPDCGAISGIDWQLRAR